MSTIEQLAERVARSEQDVAAAEAVRREATEKVGTLEGRIAQVEQELREARAAARRDPADLAALGRCGLLDQDLGDLRGLLATAQAEAAKCEPALTAARDRLGLARVELERARDDEVLTAMSTRVREIEQLLVTAVAEVHAVGRRLGHRWPRQSFAFSKALRDLVTFDHLPPTH